MECNKDEAMRAKDIAEKKMQNKDFLGARRIALKAQQLYPEIENISHILSVCDVHSSPVMLGNEMNWYDILQIEQSANAELIKKQFRKFALLLHPDKNKFPGAESAFQLIGEAQRVLLDQRSRSLYDMKYKASVGRPIPAQPMHFPNKISDVASKRSQMPEPKKTETTIPDNREKFWTSCHLCGTKFQYYKEVLNRLLRCHNCFKTFTARDIGFVRCNPHATKKQKSNGSAEVRPRPNAQASNGSFHGNFEDQNPLFSPRTKRASVSDTQHKTDEKGAANVDVNVNPGNSEQVKPPPRVVRKRRREPISKTSKAGSENEIDEGDISRRNASGIPGEKPPDKPDVSNDGNLDDVDHLPSSRKRVKKSGLSEKGNGYASKKSCVDDVGNGTEEGVKEKVDASFKGSLSEDRNVMAKKTRKKAKSKCSGIKNISEGVNDPASKVTPVDVSDSELIMFPDTDFSKFDKKEDCFKAGQVWACYDTLDVMPRCYAMIKKVHLPGFKLKITWLDPDPNDEDEIAWVNGDLPVGCGKFIHGNTEETECFTMFSHMACWEKHNKRSSYKIYPRIGETWALFMNWDIAWKSDLSNQKKLEYEFVEILSDYVEGGGIVVAHLGKLKGFSCLFRRTEKEGAHQFEVPASQLLRFSHQVPSFRMSGNEREDVPEGSFELDPAALPKNLEKIHPIPGIIEMATGETLRNGSLSPHKTSPDQASMKNSDKTANPRTYEIPDPVFHDFVADKTASGFQIGQIWALYSDEDGLPKYYALIKNISLNPVLKVHIMWLFPCSPPMKETLQWCEKDIPVGCGRFKLKGSKPQIYRGKQVYDPFSHIVTPRASDKREFMILPRKCEIWALYKLLDPEIKAEDLCKCEYEIVEILTEDEFPVKVSTLEHVKGFNSVFKAEGVAMNIPDIEMLRFSHQIPAFKLTHEKEGTLNGFWELDPAALPLSYFSSN